MSIMKSAFKRINVLYLIIALLIASCVNKIGDEIKEGNIPISFSVKTSKTTTKAAKSAFETGDRTGVFAMLTGNSLDKQRYIDNLLLECGEGSKLIPKKEVYYPEGDATLDFIKNKKNSFLIAEFSYTFDKFFFGRIYAALSLNCLEDNGTCLIIHK